MNILQAIILGIVEGITEFLPISSTGHLILASNILAIAQSDFVKSFEIVIQSGAILAVIVLYFRKIMDSIELAKRVLVAFIPTAVVGFVLYKFIKQILIGNTVIVLLSLFWGGIALILVELYFKHKSKLRESKANPHITYTQAAIIGTIQSVSVIPGVSRAAATIFGGLFLGLDRTTATEFSFLLAVPTMLAATALDLKSSSFNFDANEWIALAVGFVVSFIVAMAAIKWLLNYVKSNNFIWFGIYRIALSLLYFLLILK